MSNGDDVLDNWEEIDEVGLRSAVKKFNTSSASSCERITKNCYQNTCLTPTATTTTTTTTISATITSSSKPTQMKLLQRSTNIDSTASKPLPKSPLDNMSATFQPVMMVLHKPQDEYQSANYTQPIANQTVKILRRPTQSTEPRNNGIRPKQPIKTLQQREQEYAEARLRILGSAKNPEDDEQRASTGTTAITTSTTNSTPSTPTVTTTLLSPNPLINVLASTKISTPKIQGSSNQFNNHYNQQLQQQQQHQQQQQQYQQNYFYNQPQSPAFNNNRTYNMNPLLGLGPMGAIGQPAQYQALPSSQAQQQTQQQQQHLKFQQYHQKSPQQQHKPQPQLQQQQQQQQQQQTWSPVVGGSVSSSSLRQQQQNDTILRLPRGPDGTKGFQMRR